MHIGDKVQVKEEYLKKIANKDSELAKFLFNKIGMIVGFDEITWYFIVEFDDKKLWFRRFHLTHV